MKKWKWYVLGVLGISILAIAYSLSDFSLMNILPKGSLPEKYKSYREIAEGFASKEFQVSLLFSSDNEMRLGDFPPIFNAAKNTVIVARQTEIKKGDNTELHKTFLKLDANGELVDSLTYNKDWPMDWGGYLITPKGYCSWILDGNKEVFPYAEENGSLTDDSTKISKRFLYLYQASEFVYYYNHWDMDDPRLQKLEVDKALFYFNGKWVALYGKNLSDLSVQGYKIKGKSPVGDMVNRIDNTNLDKRNPFIYMEHFQKEYYRKSHGPSFGSPTGNSSPDRWEGTGYFDLILKKDTLHFKQDITKDEDWHSANMSPFSPPVYLYYFTNSQINFGLFANDNFRLYSIKKGRK
ncbi:hypothetical protein SAMN05216464_11093 [Mucilaginibacter pineti]|uniref:Uncharacterized protein n=1 Tax=Mucilaginibacter pineti TaxID=1391627 RepID=A0A1G7GDM5_9SPHI|nr:hypothetical protein [Mucilaginibacter pineti]SDE86191.1 hypothetical protein SAMN05216464_11093 [Mucilaginibacter pineti]